MKISKDLINLFKEQKKSINGGMIFLIIVSELSSVAIITLIGIGSSETAVREINWTHIFLFGLTIVISYFSNKLYSDKMNVVTENITNDLRKKLTAKLKDSDLYAYERIGESILLARIMKETDAISQSLPYIISLVKASTLAIFCFGYMLYLSPFAFIIFTSFSGLGYLIYDHYNKISYEYWNIALKKDVSLFDAFANILHGFKEIKLSSKKKEEIYDIFTSVSNELIDYKIKSWKVYNANDNFYYALIYVAVGIIIFALPSITPMKTADSIKLLALIIYVLNPFWTIASSIPAIGQIDITLQLILEVERKLDASSERVAVDDADGVETITDFSEIRFEDVSFQYYEKDLPAFKAGPFDFSIKKGEILFITGGNGCGKSTLLKLIATLYHSQTGNISVDNTKITRKLIKPYRELFGSVFSDFHLFDKLYGVAEVDEDRLHKLLQLMQIDDKTQYVNGGFTAINLSTGQKKRLALVAALMENRPIYLLDEWAAEQDPYFHHYYYKTLLPDLKKQGKTLVVISHDDRYFGSADRLVKMEYGQIVSIT